MFRAGPVSRRPRPSRSCARCARRKVRCDKARPTCSRCAQGGLDCSYEDLSRSFNEPLTFIDETPSVIADHASLYGRLNRLGGMLQAVGNSNESEGQPKKPDLSDELGHLYLAPQTKSRYVSAEFFAMISQEMAEINHLMQQQQQYTLDPELYLREPGGDDTYSRGSTGVEDGKEDTKTFSGRLCGDIFPQPPAWYTEDNITSSTTRIPHLNVMLEDLPSKEQCEALIWVYMKGYHTISPLFHGLSFMQQARKYLERNFTSSADIDLHFLALLLAVLFVGCAICPRKRLSELFLGSSREILSSIFYQRAVRAIRMTNFPQAPSLNSLSAFIVINTVWLREEQPLACCSFIGLATRVAQMLGLHKDPESFEGVSKIDVQVRRQLWWTLVAVDSQVALASGLPPIIDCSSCQVRKPSEMPEESFVPGIRTHERFDKTILGILAGGKVEFYKNASKILHVIHSTKFFQQDLEYILGIIRHIESDIAARQQQISDIEVALISTIQFEDRDGGGMTNLRETQSNPVLARFAKSVLSILAAKPYAIIQGPVRRRKLDSYLRERAPESILCCRRYLLGFLKITQSSEFQPWHWRWPGQHQPLHSIMTLILELERSPNDSMALETRRLVDLAIFMCGTQENHGIMSSEDGSIDSRPLSISGSKAWDFIRHTRARVWTEAGLDPTILTCPDRAEDINIEGNISSSYEVSPAIEEPLNMMWDPSELNDNWYNFGPTDDFSFDPSLFFAGGAGDSI